MQTAQAKPIENRVRPWLVRIMTLLVFIVVLGWGFQWAARVANAGNQPAGLGQGIVHGALMPMALPNLLIGNDVPIYAERNAGVPYKLGYTIGVNGCGAIFFAILYWRLRHLRRRFLRETKGEASASEK